MSTATISRVHSANSKFQLQRILPRYHIVNPLQLLAVELRRPSEQRLRFQRAPAAAPVVREPPVDRRAPDAEYTRYNFGAFALLHNLHRAFAQRFQSRMIQLAGVIFSHTSRESCAIHAVKKNVLLLIAFLIAAILRGKIW
jgi:hypothetical protein